MCDILGVCGVYDGRVFTVRACIGYDGCVLCGGAEGECGRYDVDGSWEGPVAVHF